MCRKALLFLFILVPAFSSVAQDSIKVEGRIAEATVFFSGVELVREAKVSLGRGESKVVFEGLTPYIDEQSMKMQAGEDLRIRSLERRSYTQKPEGRIKKRIEAKEDSIEEIDFKRSLRRSLKKVYGEEKQLILTNRDIKGEQDGVDVEDLMELAVYYRKRLKDIEYKIIEVENDLKELQEQRNKIDERLRKLRKDAERRASKVIAHIESESAGQQKLSLSYFSSRSGWTPSYELNAPSLSDPVEMTYKGDVWQNTERDWKDVDLTLASGRPTRSGDQPELNPWWLNFYEPRPQNVKLRGSRTAPKKGGMPQQQRQRMDKKETQGVVREMEAFEDEVDMDSEPSSTVHTRFAIESKYSIPSGRSRRSVKIRTMTMKAQHDHLTIPKKEPEAFLIAKLSDWEASDLFPGRASVQYAGRYVGKTMIDPGITQDTLEVSLGRDKGVNIEREKVKDKTSSQIIGSKKTLETAIDIKIKNRRSEKIDIRVKDQIPLSKREDVEVSLEERSGAEYDEESGELSWRLSIEAGKSETLRFAFSIKYPKELHPSGL